MCVCVCVCVYVCVCDLTKGYWMRNNQNRGWKWDGNLYNIITKYNTRLRREEGTHCSWWLLSILTPITVVSNVFMRNGSYPLIFIGKVSNNIYIYIYIYIYISIWLLDFFKDKNIDFNGITLFYIPSSTSSSTSLKGTDSTDFSDYLSLSLSLSIRPYHPSLSVGPSVDTELM